MKKDETTTADAVWDREWIGPAAILGLKELLASKFGDRDARERAAIFADALHRMVQSRLPDLDEAQKTALRLKLVRILCTEKGKLTDRDVLEECLRLQPLTDEDLAVLSDWVGTRTGSKPVPHELRAWAELVLANLPLPDMRKTAAAFDRDSAPSPEPATAHRPTTVASSVGAAPPALQQMPSAAPSPEAAAESPTAAALAAQSQTAAACAQPSATPRVPGWFRHAAAAGLLLALIGFGVGTIADQQSPEPLVLAEGQTSQSALTFLPAAPPAPLMDNGLPRQYQHRYVNTEQLQIWLTRKNSKLAETPYFTTMLDTAKAYNLHPYLLFAVSGQENGYVQTDHPDVEKIANNPFNVYHSWWEYNTDIADSSRIAAKTIVRLSWDQPEDVHPFQWINREYAEDPNWWKGVKAIFEQMERDIPLAAP